MKHQNYLSLYAGYSNCNTIIERDIILILIPFSPDSFRHLSFLYFYPLLYSFGIWILCIIYNRPLPRTKLFLITELVKLAPGYAVILGAIGLEIYYWATEDDYLIHFILFVELMVLIVAM